MMQRPMEDIQNEVDFEKRALQTFNFQANNCIIYRNFLKLLNFDIKAASNVLDIPFLPIQFFKSHKVVSNYNPIEQIFLSSGTTGDQSQHLVTDLAMYIESYRRGFAQFYGNIEDYIILALLPSYLEREGSSLIYMIADLIKKSNNEQSGFFLENTPKMIEIIKKAVKNDKKLLILGVSYALLDLVESHQFNLKGAIIMETGGMKGRRKEMIREELHAALTKGFGVDKIHSEYGMTELLSQGYSQGDGIFECPPWMKILIRDTEDPLSLVSNGKTGGVNVIDLANINSCSFIATQDLGKKFDNGTFEILGRFDNSDIRGCNLLIQ